MYNLTREQALAAMVQGKKVTHTSFTDGEYLCIVDGVMLDENGYHFIEGWQGRNMDPWLTGWGIYIADHPVYKMIRAQLVESQEANAEHKAIEALFEKHKGKQLTRVVKNADFAQYKFSTETINQMHLTGKYRHFIGYRDSDKVADPVTFRERDAGYGYGTEKAIHKLENMDVHRLIEIWETIKGHYEGLRTAFGDLERAEFTSYNNPVYYPMLTLIQCPDDLPHGTTTIRLSDMYFARK